MLSRVMHGHAAMTADMDLRLSEALGTSQGYWLALQTQRDLWTARQTAKERKRIKRMTAPELESARVRGATMTTLRGDGVIGRPVRSRERRVRVPHYPPPICPRLARA